MRGAPEAPCVHDIRSRGCRLQELRLVLPAEATASRTGGASPLRRGGVGRRLTDYCSRRPRSSEETCVCCCVRAVRAPGGEQNALDCRSPTPPGDAAPAARAGKGAAAIYAPPRQGSWLRIARGRVNTSQTCALRGAGSAEAACAAASARVPHSRGKGDSRTAFTRGSCASLSATAPSATASWVVGPPPWVVAVLISPSARQLSPGAGASADRCDHGGGGSRAGCILLAPPGLAVVQHVRAPRAPEYDAGATRCRDGARGEAGCAGS